MDVLIFGDIPYLISARSLCCFFLKFEFLIIIHGGLVLVIFVRSDLKFYIRTYIPLSPPSFVSVCVSSGGGGEEDEDW